MSHPLPVCCTCRQVANRCATDTCPCYINNQLCSQTCESGPHRGDCLNAAITRCSCVPQAPTGKPAKSSGRQSQKPQATFCNTASCECSRSHEACSADCACGGGCLNEQSPHFWAVPRPDPPSKASGCKCASGRKACSRASKCPCVGSMSHCSAACKSCVSPACNNAPVRAIPDRTRYIFNHPTTALDGRPTGQDPCGGMAVVGKFRGPGGYSYRLIINSSEERGAPHPIELLCELVWRAIAAYHIPLDSITVYASRSPCYHQDCNPKCDVLEDCTDGIACAKRLRTLYKQLQRQQSNTNLIMTVKVLSPYTARGDLYTRHALLCMIESGISVQPLTLKDWRDILADSEPIAAPISVTMGAWSRASMDRYVSAMQYYINSCNRAVGDDEGQWVSPFHELLKNTILTLGVTQHRLERLSGEMDVFAQTSTFGSQCDLQSAAYATLERKSLLGRKNKDKKQAKGGIKSTQSSIPRSHSLMDRNKPTKLADGGYGSLHYIPGNEGKGVNFRPKSARGSKSGKLDIVDDPDPYVRMSAQVFLNDTGGAGKTLEQTWEGGSTISRGSYASLGRYSQIPSICPPAHPPPTSSRRPQSARGGLHGSGTGEGTLNKSQLHASSVPTARSPSPLFGQSSGFRGRPSINNMSPIVEFRQGNEPLTTAASMPTSQSASVVNVVADHAKDHANPQQYFMARHKSSRSQERDGSHSRSDSQHHHHQQQQQQHHQFRDEKVQQLQVSTSSHGKDDPMVCSRVSDESGIVTSRSPHGGGQAPYGTINRRLYGVPPSGAASQGGTAAAFSRFAANSASFAEKSKRLEAMVLNFSSRRLTDYERSEMQQEILSCLDKVQNLMIGLLGYIEDRSSAPSHGAGGGPENPYAI